MYENEERITETEVVDGLRALLYGESIEDTLLDGSHTETFRDGGYLTYDEGFVIRSRKGSRTTALRNWFTVLSLHLTIPAAMRPLNSRIILECSMRSAPGRT